ncbi:TIGR03084 family metal-binding protein [Mycolicibacter senuensis]|uniref:TIGR03084 family metal-binding protein n=1 Tax=Mycolicibacter senuensis TaxID=386913 RepID=UPI000DCDE820|nr:TIGR03084 family metal-binding protein [Mycolicibacter senuensis]RAV01584.1 TIGR03084 family protein [Mycolicibacter senuensis]
MALDFTKLLNELQHESDRLLACLDGLHAEQWEEPTPAAGWAIRDQISHLAYFDDVAVLAITDPSEFRRVADGHMSGGMDFPDRVAEQFRSHNVAELFEWFSRSRATLVTTFTGEDPRRRIPWFGPEMSVASSATARLMETWAHGQDVYDALGRPHPPSTGLRSIAHLGVSTFAFTHRLHDRTVPDEPVRVELCSPDGSEVWTWGPADAANRVRGRAVDFVGVVTQRRHWADTELVVKGDVAGGWLDIAQAFAGAPGTGRPRTVVR